MKFKKESKHVVLHGLEFSVDFQYRKNKDPFGTGDSPTEIELEEVEVNFNGYDLTDYLSESVIQSVRENLLDYVREIEA